MHQILTKSRVPCTYAFYLGLAVLLALFMPESGDAQALYGSITGNVQDPNGAAIPGATVTITNTETNQTREVTTDDSGGYTVPNVQGGNYTVNVSHQGFKAFSKTNVAVTLNSITRTDFI
ncbi:MAG: carboxypeptidase-like regulatory domain-containing protein, partial [Acidobacteriota bacterium]|nr:carboxypeptidase-like regulatory domain-containing protein [Acidobacteriota bacterium]